MDKNELKSLIKEVLAESGGGGSVPDAAAKVQNADSAAKQAITNVQNVFAKLMDGDTEDENAFWNAYRDSLAAYGEFKKEEVMAEKVEAKGKTVSEEGGMQKKLSKEEAEKMVAIEEFMERNKEWYGPDKKWTRYANTMSGELEEDPRWMHKTTDEKLEYIESTVAEMKGEKEDKEVVKLFDKPSGAEAKAEVDVEKPSAPLVDFGSGHGFPGESGKGGVTIGKEPLEMLKELGLGDEKTVRRFAAEIGGRDG